VDAVKYNGNYYVARTDAGNGFSGIIPSNTDYWNSFGAQFESVATNLLLAENANIAGWVFRNERIESQSGGAFLNGKTGEVAITGKFESSKEGDRIIIDPNLKTVKMINSNNRVVLDMSFYNDAAYGSSASVLLYNYDSKGNQIGRTQIYGGILIVNQNNRDIINIGLDPDNNLGLFIDVEKLPTSGKYYGQIYRNGNNLCVKYN
jgi:hypothetical protein